MNSRGVICLGLGLALTLAGLTQAQDQPAAGQPPPPRAAVVERRLAGLEAQVTKLLDEVRRLRAEVKGQPSQPDERADVRVFALQYADAVGLLATLRQIFPAAVDTEFRMAADARTNTLLVYGTAGQIDGIAALLERLDVPERKAADQREKGPQ
jgi:type II/III secretion system protein